VERDVVSYVHSTRELRSDAATRHYARERRARRKAAGDCINGISHGPATYGVRCWDCVAQHLRHDLLPASHRAHLAALRLQRELRTIASTPALLEDRR
jgi:hypothetical protein